MQVLSVSLGIKPLDDILYMQRVEIPHLIFQVPLLQLGVNASDVYSSCLRSGKEVLVCRLEQGLPSQWYAQT